MRHSIEVSELKDTMSIIQGPTLNQTGTSETETGNYDFG